MVFAQAGDEEIYGRLLEELGSYLEALFRRLRIHPELIEDAVQDTLLAVHRARATYDAERPFGPWLLALARHKAIDLERWHGRRWARELQQVDTELVSWVAGERVETKMDLESALAALSESAREALLMTKLWGLSTEEGADAVGIAPSAFKSRVHRAVLLARRLLQGRRSR